MKGKVTCPNCGHSWNKSDSSVKDMHVCHNCGKSDVNMKNGGWLDNYGEEANANDGYSSAPDNWVGDGYSNVGRNYSPAWGGQFQNGGKKKPLYVESKNDPRYQAYQDSLKAYNEGNYKYNNIKKTGNLKDLKVDLDSEKKLPFNKFIKEYNYNDNAFNLFNEGTGKNMKPLSISHFRGDGVLGYLDYGNQALYKKPQQQVIVKDKTNTSSGNKSESQYKKEHPPIYVTDKNDPRINRYTEEGSQYLYKPVEKKPVRAIKNNLDPEGLVLKNLDVNSKLPTIRHKAKNAKSYKVKETTQGIYGPSTVDYEVTDPRNINMNDLGPGNTRVVTPNYAMGGSIPGAVGFSYTRTQSPAPSNGPYAKKTKASAENGGWLSKYEDAQNGYQTGEDVTYGTPEYTEAYNKGEVVTEDGQRSPILLDEVTIQNDYKRPRGFLEQYADKIAEENKDAGLFGAIVGTPISAITSLPQLAATYGITGEMQRPSEAMDIQNPIGAFAVDAVADPANLIGAGVLTKENALSKLGRIPTSIAPELRQGLRTNGLSFRSSIDNVEDKVASLLEENKKWLSSEEGKRRLINIGVDPKSLEYPKITYNKGSSSGYISGNTNEINIDLDEIDQLRKEGLPIDLATLVDHELAHWLQKHKAENSDQYMDLLLRYPDKSPYLQKLDFDTNIDNFLRDKFVDGNERDFFKRVKEGKLSTIPNDVRMHNSAHFIQEQEPFAYTREFRRDLLNNGYLKNIEDKVTVDMVDKFMKNNRQNRVTSLLSVSSPDIVKKFINTINESPALLPVGLGIGAASQIEQQRQGGIINSDRGQWDHPGKVTRVKGGKITMKPDPKTGKPLTQPLLGIANTGERKMMYPGQDYQFQEGTEYVTEYPKSKLAKNGNQLVKLDQLTNFTNYNKPQPGGWLNKYN